MQKTFTYLALGDSYTIGEAVLLAQSFPYQTVQQLRKDGFRLSAPEMLAKTGWTTEELQAGIANYQFLEKYDVVSLLIGVNNQYRGQGIILYKEQFEALLNRAIQLAGGKNAHVFVLSIPDYSRTPFALNSDREKISKELDEYNSLNKAICIQYKVPYIDITEDDRHAGTGEDLVATDGLHPSAKAYAGWAEKLAPAISRLLSK